MRVRCQCLQCLFLSCSIALVSGPTFVHAVAFPCYWEQVTCNMQVVVLEETCLMIMMSSWRQNLRVKAGYSMKKYVSTVYVSSESNKDK